MFDKEPSLSVLLKIVASPTKIPRRLLIGAQAGLEQEVILRNARGYYQFSRDPKYATCAFKVDTGAAVTVIKKADWVGRGSQIQWLHEPKVTPQADGLPAKKYTLGGVGGGKIDVFLGRVSLCFFNSMRPTGPVLKTTLVAGFDADGSLNTTLMGLGGDAFRNGGLCLNGSTNEVHLVRI